MPLTLPSGGSPGKEPWRQRPSVYVPSSRASSSCCCCCCCCRRRRRYPSSWCLTGSPLARRAAPLGRRLPRPLRRQLAGLCPRRGPRREAHHALAPRPPRAARQPHLCQLSRRLSLKLDPLQHVRFSAQSLFPSSPALPLVSLLIDDDDDEEDDGEEGDEDDDKDDDINPPSPPFRASD